jgi:hypothetical protein
LFPSVTITSVAVSGLESLRALGPIEELAEHTLRLSLFLGRADVNVTARLELRAHPPDGEEHEGKSIWHFKTPINMTEDAVCAQKPDSNPKTLKP